MTDLQSPAVLLGGRYELGELLGTGATSRVHRARDTVLERDVAVKVFRHDVEASDAARVQTEVRTLASLSHPNLVAVHDAVAVAGPDGRTTSYLVMELVDGPTLAACCLDGELPLHRVAEIGSQLAAALAHVHERGIVHRDVKPANILLGSDGRARLADFGIVRILDEARLTGTGLTIGTAPYLSPEQVRGRDVGPPADVYALGLVLLECLTGRREYDGGPVECALARLDRRPFIPTTLPAPWPALLDRMTADDAADRPTAVEVAQALTGGSRNPPPAMVDPTLVGPAAPAPARATRLPQRPSRVAPTGSHGVGRRPAMVGAGLLIAVVLATVVGVAAVHARRGSTGSAGVGPTPGPSAPVLERHLDDLRRSVQP